MECFRIDESGYTGFDLLNRDQRFQGATAVAISDADASAQKHLGRAPGGPHAIYIISSPIIDSASPRLATSPEPASIDGNDA
ncbi:hypothetical protein ASE72_19010 [Sphingomonas sp. Leaf20]|jgi:hypothetical protein|nr:hypothetical protein ASE72_19010 [Sphingomonas sp. Leaf20]